MDIPPVTEIFHRNYRYLSSQIPALVRHFQKFSFEIYRKTKLKPSRTSILEIGCNDGVFLRPLLARGTRKLVGVDPGPDLPWRHSRVRHHRHPFSKKFAERLFRMHGFFDVITASNVFSHMESLQSAAEGIGTLLRPGGWFVCEVHPLLSVVQGFQYDMIYHEHFHYHTLRSLRTLLAPPGLQIVDLDMLEMHAGSIRVWARKMETPQSPSSSLSRWHRREVKAGVGTFGNLRRFAQKVNVHRKKFRTLALALARTRGPLVGFGASGRANTLLQAAGLDQTLISAVADDAPSKQGWICPGSGVPIFSCAETAKIKPRSLILLAWSYQKWILPKIRKTLKHVEKVLVPLPRLRFLCPAR